MHAFRYIGDKLHCERLAIEPLARKFGTPLFVYSQSTLQDHFQKLDSALSGVDHLVCFSVKSNSNLSILRLLHDLGSGFDIVSGGELQRVIDAGGDPRKCVFAGVGKTGSEIEFALKQGVYAFNAESEPELERIQRVAARLRKIAPVAVRVNPNITAHTHAKITTGTYENKFGVAFEQIEAVYARASRLKNLRLVGLQMHIGSQITAVAPFEAGVRKVLPLALKLKQQYGIQFLSIGGGLGVIYDPALASGSAKWWRSSAARNILTAQSYAARLVPLLKPSGLRILVEPGRFISGNAGILVTRIEYVKRTGRKNFLIVDAAMNDLIRPALYDAYHEIVPVVRRKGRPLRADVVGPVCESGDFFSKDRSLPQVGPGDYLALLSAGAYGSVMGSNYNTRPLPAEVLVHGNKAGLVRERQAIKKIWAGEKIAPWLK
ncbi:MAG TPA: diaminopimelate decarboxylase [Verrucomicrobiae bacterium]|nr:diaminopimelate decarboxylase [Verrucomicrobiae bacterium]